jgi:hypothetical protein
MINGPSDMLRITEPPIKCENFRGHSGKCKFCEGIVKMRRSVEFPYTLQPLDCWCLLCGQSYYVELKPGEDIGEFDTRQWAEKGEDHGG